MIEQHMPTQYRIIPLVLLLLGAFSPSPAQENKWNLEEIFSSTTFSQKSLSGVEWVDGGKKISYLDTVSTFRSIYTLDFSDGERELVLDGRLLKANDSTEVFRIGAYVWSPDEHSILVTGTLPARRTKTGGNFGLFDIEAKTFRLLTNTDEPQSIIQFSPDGNSIGFVRSNNIFVVDVESGIEKQLTVDGSDETLNGNFDWVYEEEFKVITGWEWSPDGKRIAFWHLDVSNEPEFPIVRYPRDSAHADLRMMKYPKPGDPVAEVRIGVVNVADGDVRWIDLGPTKDVYVPRIQWTRNPEVLSVQKINRMQDTLQLLLADIETGSVTQVLEETSDGWIFVHNNLRFLERTEQFIWTSNRDGYNHVYLYNLDGTLVKQLTKGEWEVTEILEVNERRRLVYFVGTKNSPLERHLYSVRLDGSRTTTITKEPGTHDISLSPDFLVYLDAFSSTTRPSQSAIYTNDGTRVATLVENTRDVLRGYAISEQQFFSFTTLDNVALNGWMIKPHDFDPKKKYPVLMFVYGGPGSQTVKNMWGSTSFYWYQLLAQNGYFIVSIDNRGTGARGRDFMQTTLKQLGVWETHDQIEGARYLASLPYIDSTRIGIWGWSYGGYMTCMAMTLGAEYFKVGVAGAPVTHWRYYDAIYTERYMKSLESNPNGYEESSPITHASELKGNLLIVHGTEDDNVHWQNTIAFVDELIRQRKQVSTMFYPGKTHSVRGLHLYTLITDFLLKHL